MNMKNDETYNVSHGQKLGIWYEQYFRKQLQKTYPESSIFKNRGDDEAWCDIKANPGNWSIEVKSRKAIRHPGVYPANVFKTKVFHQPEAQEQFKALIQCSKNWAIVCGVYDGMASHLINFTDDENKRAQKYYKICMIAKCEESSTGAIYGEFEPWAFFDNDFKSIDDFLNSEWWNNQSRVLRWEEFDLSDYQPNLSGWGKTRDAYERPEIPTWGKIAELAEPAEPVEPAELAEPAEPVEPAELVETVWNLADLGTFEMFDRDQPSRAFHAVHSFVVSRWRISKEQKKQADEYNLNTPASSSDYHKLAVNYPSLPYVRIMMTRISKGKKNNEIPFVKIPEEVQKYLKENGLSLYLGISTGIKHKWHKVNQPGYKLTNLTTRKIPNWAFIAYDNLKTAGLLDQYLVTEDNPLDFTVDFSHVDALDAMCTIKPEVIGLITSVDPVYAELRRIREINI